MSKTRIFIDNYLYPEIEIILSKSQSHYLINVLRKKKGDELYLFNEQNGEWSSLIKSIKTRTVVLIVKKKIRNTSDVVPLDLWLCFGVIKPKNIGYLVQKTSEIGLTKIVPIKTELSEKMKLNYQRLNKICTEAVEQSKGIVIPEVSKEIPLNEILKNWEDDRIIFVCDELKEKYDILKTILDNYQKKIAIFIGPVAGWSKEDINILKKKKPLFISLGNTLLKADTAAIFALSCFKIVRDFKNEK